MLFQLCGASYSEVIPGRPARASALPVLCLLLLAAAAPVCPADVGCGANAVASMARFSGVAVTGEVWAKIRAACGAETESLASVSECLKGLGIAAQPVAATAEEIVAIRGPRVVHLVDGDAAHFSTCVGGTIGADVVCWEAAGPLLAWESLSESQAGQVTGATGSGCKQDGTRPCPGHTPLACHDAWSPVDPPEGQPREHMCKRTEALPVHYCEDNPYGTYYSECTKSYTPKAHCYVARYYRTWYAEGCCGDSLRCNSMVVIPAYSVYADQTWASGTGRSGLCEMDA